MKYVKWRPAALFVLLGALLTACFALYRLPLRAVLYPLALTGCVGAVFLVRDALRTKRKHDRLRALHEDELPEGLPPAADVIERDCRRIIEELCAVQAEQTRAADARYRGMMDYYTAWVHQIKTPIAAMRLRLQNHDTPEARALLLDLGRIERYVEMVMTYLRLDSASTDYCFRRCDLDALVRGVVRGFAGEFIDRRLELDYEPVSLTVLTDEKWLAFVLGQVLSNALKYTPSGRISIFLCAPRTLCIRDTGIGIAPEELPRVFENGFTGFNGRVDRRASGIGLYLCRRVCVSLGHEIAITSAVGEGTSVCISFPEREM